MPKTKRQDAYVARLAIEIPLNLADNDALATANAALNAIAATLPAGSTCTITDKRLGKMAAAGQGAQTAPANESHVDPHQGRDPEPASSGPLHNPDGGDAESGAGDLPAFLKREAA